MFHEFSFIAGFGFSGLQSLSLSRPFLSKKSFGLVQKEKRKSGCAQSEVRRMTWFRKDEGSLYKGNKELIIFNVATKHMCRLALPCKLLLLGIDRAIA